MLSSGNAKVAARKQSVLTSNQIVVDNCVFYELNQQYRMVEEKSINLLWNCAKELTTATHAERLLKSYYTNTCRKLAKHSIQLPADCVGAARMCKRCGNQWADGNYELQLQPQRLANNAKRRRLIARLDVEKEKAKAKQGKLSIGARKRAKWLKKRMASNIAVDCSLCGHNTMLPLEKPKKRSKAAETIAPPTATTKTTEVASKKKKKKNKNQDVNAGLKLPPPQTQSQQQQQQLQKTPTAQKAAPTTTKTTSTPKAAGQNSKQKKKTKTTPAVSSAAPKVQSKTQKQNALLQLAAQLKSHAFKTASKTPQDRLQALLK
ncbi:uncharacterized protein LOC117571296 [Drosophila albomicans]|uniref:Uncharacterized protein LOC117571296 n=1 Tax=Drosophila albomicans TaxID=7291 RepID=A0A6P8XB13_DROAB|nr:uncharacterized protein LOC117571296 [Drosophila albomicans]